jgi:hypothetical protein
LITDPNWLRLVLDVYENDFSFSNILDFLFHYLQIPNDNPVVAGYLHTNQSLEIRLDVLRFMEFAAIKQDREALMLLDVVRLISERRGYFNPDQSRVNLETVSPS